METICNFSEGKCIDLVKMMLDVDESLWRKMLESAENNSEESLRECWQESYNFKMGKCPTYSEIIDAVKLLKTMPTFEEEISKERELSNWENIEKLESNMKWY